MWAKLKGYRTMITSALFTALGGIASIPDILTSSGISWTTILGDEIKQHSGIIIMAISIVFAILRWITTTPVGVAEPK